ncbi:MAG: hypothetical protein E3J56_12800, partial [Candidatus Aminicenantes bacterium]
MMKYLRAIKAITINRVSTAEQAKDEKYSLPAQVKDNREYCEKKGLNVIKEFTFDESATADKRKKFEEAIKLIKTSSEAIAVVADRVDRFQRGWKETVEFDDLRRDGKVELHFVRQGLTLHRNSDPYELMGWDAHAMFARAYVLQLKANVKKGIKGKLEKGEFPGYTVTGYKNVVTQNGDGSITKEIQVDEDKAKYVKMCFDLYATERYTVGELAEKMRDLGFRVKAKKMKDGNGDGRDIMKTDVLGILHNPFPTGEFYWPNPETGERELYPNKGTYPTLITKKLYDKVQNIIANNNTRHNGFKKNNFKFRGLLKCHFCGSTLTPEEMSRTYGENSKSKNINQVYYHCSNGKSLVNADYYEKKFGRDHSGVRTFKKGKKKGQTVISCPQRWWKEEEIEEFILHEFDAMHYDDEVYKILKIFLKKDYEKRMEEADKSIRGFRNKLGKVGKIIDGLMDKIALTKNKRLEEDLERRYNNLKKEQEDLRDRMKSYEDGKGIDTDKTIDAMKLACDLRKHYLGLPFEKQRELLSMCFNHIVACKGEWRVNEGRGKRVKAKSLYPVLNEPFVTLQSVNLLDEILPLEEAYVHNAKLTKKMRE